MVPGGQARVRVGGVELEGLGYAECLSMSGNLAPLGFRELLWGRFTGSSNHLVWLAWIGAEPITLVLRNGEEVPGASVPDPEEGGVFAGEYRLVLDQPRIIRAVIADRTLPWALRLGVPAWLRGIREEKWIASARLEDGSGTSEEGWAIYERVTWP